jgi:hypothetical protein
MVRSVDPLDSSRISHSLTLTQLYSFLSVNGNNKKERRWSWVRAPTQFFGHNFLLYSITARKTLGGMCIDQFGVQLLNMGLLYLQKRPADTARNESIH